MNLHEVQIVQTLLKIIIRSYRLQLTLDKSEFQLLYSYCKHGRRKYGISALIVANY